jgi:hypothetical protein
MLIDFIQSIALFVISGSCLFGYWTTHRRVARLEQELFRLKVNLGQVDLAGFILGQVDEPSKVDLDGRRRTSGRG